MSSSRRLGAFASICAVALLASGAGCGDDAAPPLPLDASMLDGGAIDGSTLDGGDGDGGAPGDPYEPAPTPAPWSDAARADLEGRIDTVLASADAAGTTRSILVTDLETGQVIYAREPDLALEPASNTKLFTTATAFSELGPDHRTALRVLGTGALGADGIVAGDLFVRGEHDFSASGFFFDAPTVPLDRLASRLYDAGVRGVAGALVVGGELVYDGYQFGTFDAETHRMAFALSFEAALEARGIAVPGVRTTTSFDAPSGATELARWDTMPLAVALYPLNETSHNEFADVLVRHVGWVARGQSSYPAGTAEVIDWLSRESITDTTAMRLNDGSGLSHDNRVSARNVVDLITHMLDTPIGSRWLHTLSVAGAHGTLGRRLTGADTAGRFFGKTGTLSDAIATSGVLYHRHDGRRYALSILFNAVTDQAASRRAEDAIVQAVAADRGGVVRPSEPVLRSALGDATGSSITLAWDAVPGADGYVVWLGPDGRRFDRAKARLVHATRFVAGGLDEGTQAFARVTAVAAGVESAPSDVLVATVSREGAAVLLVDANDRWERQPSPENTLGGAHDFLVPHAEALTSLAVDSVANEVIAAGEVDLSSYAVIVWALGEEGVDDESFSAGERAALVPFADSGGALVVSGAEVGFDLVASGTTEEAAFFSRTLAADYVADDAGTVLAEGTGALAAVGDVLFYAPATVVVAYPDVLAPAAGGATVLSYVGGTGGAAGVLRSSGGGSVFTLGFPIEAIEGTRERAALVSTVLSAAGVAR